MFNKVLENTIDLSKGPLTHFDAIVVGAGMGGSAAVYSLVKQGFQVLLIEKGNAF